MRTVWASRWHLLTAVVAVAALVTQLVLTISGSAVLLEDDPPGLGQRLAQFFAYFTIQSNLLIALTTALLVVDPASDGAGFRILRAAGLVGMTVTGLVHFTLLRPLLDLDGLDYVVDKALHMVVPALAIVGWAAFGPRPRLAVATLGWALLWPIAWVVETLVVGGLTGWFPYPFLDYDDKGWGEVLVACVGITALFVVVSALALAVDRRLAPAPQEAP